MQQTYSLHNNEQEHMSDGRGVMVCFLFFGKLKHSAVALKLAFNQKIKSIP